MKIIQYTLITSFQSSTTFHNVCGHNSPHFSSLARLSHALHSTCSSHSEVYMVYRSKWDKQLEVVQCKNLHNPSSGISHPWPGSKSTQPYAFKCSCSVRALGIRPAPELAHKIIPNKDFVSISPSISQDC